MAYSMNVDTKPRHIPCKLKVHSYKGKDYAEFVGKINVGNRAFLVKPQSDVKDFQLPNGDMTKVVWVDMIEFDPDGYKNRKKGF